VSALRGAGCAALMVIATGAGAPAHAAGAPWQARGADSPANRPQIPDSIVEARTREIAAGLRCVVCQGLSIEDSPAELAREMRAIVKEQVAAGRTRAEIEAYFVARYGEFVLLAPRPEGFNLLVYALPVVALVLGALFVVGFVRRWGGAEPDASPQGTGAEASRTRGG